MAVMPASVFQVDKDSRDGADLLVITMSSNSFSYFATSVLPIIISGYLQPVISPALRPPTF